MRLHTTNHGLATHQPLPWHLKRLQTYSFKGQCPNLLRLPAWLKEAIHIDVVCPVIHHPPKSPEMGSTNHPQMVGLYSIELPTVCHFCSTKSGQVGISEGFPGHVGHICDHLWILLYQPAVHRQCGTRLRLFHGNPSALELCECGLGWNQRDGSLLSHGGSPSHHRFHQVMVIHDLDDLGLPHFRKPPNVNPGFLFTHRLINWGVTPNRINDELLSRLVPPYK